MDGYGTFEKPIVPLDMQQLSIGDVIDNVWAHNKLFILPRFECIAGDNHIEPHDDAVFVEKSDQSLWADRDNERIVPAVEYEGSPSCIGLLVVPELEYHPDSVDDKNSYLLADLRYYDAKLPIQDNYDFPDDTEEQDDYYDYMESIAQVDGFIVRTSMPTPYRQFDMYGPTFLNDAMLQLTLRMDALIDSITPEPEPEPEDTPKLYIPGQPDPDKSAKKTQRLIISLEGE